MLASSSYTTDHFCGDTLFLPPLTPLRYIKDLETSVKVFNADLKHRFRMPTRVVNLMQLIFCPGRFMMLLRVVLGISLSGAYTSV